MCQYILTWYKPCNIPQVYYPVVFSLYNPQLVYPLQDQSIPSITQQLKVSEHTGFWREFGYGMTCVSRGDYEAVGGYLDIRTWGKEDEALFQTFLTKEHIKVRLDLTFWHRNIELGDCTLFFDEGTC